MITIKEAEEILKKEYHIDNFEYLAKEILLPDYSRERHEVSFDNSLFSSVTMLGESKTCDVTIFEVMVNDGCQNRRVGITQAMFRILRGLHINNALVAFVNADKNNYRISLLTSKYEFDGDKIVKVLSNPRRYSYSLGYGTKTKTAYKFLIEKDKVSSLNELISRFSVEVVNKQFYTEIATAFTELVGGERNGRKYEKLLELYSVVDHNKYAEFGVRLIGRIMFCWFLREKRSENGIPLVPDNILSLDTVIKSDNYYHQILEPLFFELLNTNQKRRKPEYQSDCYNKVPYLNGGLFSPHTDDLYKYDSVNHCGAYGVVTIPNEWFEHLYAILNEYNFTVDENTAYDIELSIDPEMLGRIFENLLAEINPETGENAKKSTGSFYTPRDIVDYMVDSSLCEFLKNKTSIEEERIKALISYSKENSDLAVFDKTEKKKLIEALYTVTVLDPACGSGAFPIGMLQKIVYILQELDPDANLWFDKVTENVSIFIKKEFEKKFTSGSLNYIRKLSVIQNSIFGIDIQPIAVEISRLRCFLSLIIEEKVNDNEENRGINPLPNLDFKFITANSLLPLPYNDNSPLEQTSIFENQNHMERLKAVREEYFGTDDNDIKNELKLEFSEIQKEMFQQTISMGKMASAKYSALTNWSPFKNEATDWFDADWMFGIKEGFDIIIGNPPYIQLQKAISENGTKMGDIYSKSNFSTFARTGDIYCLFYEKGVNLINNGGFLCFITSNKWMRAGYGESLRAFLSQNTNPITLIDFAGTKVFEAATVDVNILLLNKGENQRATRSVIVADNCLNNLSVYVEQNCVNMIFDNRNSWSILSNIEQSIKRKIEKAGIPLKKFGVSINYGIKTGLNDAFIIDSAKKDELISLDPKSAEIIRPILRGRDIKRYSYLFANLWVILASYGSYTYLEKEYPAIYQHLSQYKTQLMNRGQCRYTSSGKTNITKPYPGQHHWLELDNNPSKEYLDDFSKPKIVWGNLCQSAQYTIAEDFLFVSAPSPIITGANKYILALLNSKLLDWYIRQLGVTRNGGYFEYKPMFVEKLPIPRIDIDKQLPFINLVDTIINNKTNGIDCSKDEALIDKMVFDLYDLTEEERRFVLEY